MSDIDRFQQGIIELGRLLNEVKPHPFRDQCFIKIQEAMFWYETARRQEEAEKEKDEK